MAQILVVDDESDIRILVQSALELEGHTVREADSAEGALEILERHDPDIVISDIHMGGMSGFDLLSRVRNKPATMHTPFIFITGVGGRDAFRKGMDLGADDFLDKPFSKEELLASVRSRLKMRTLMKEQSDRAMNDLRQSISLALPHEFRTPLNSVLAFSKILSEDDEVTPEEVKKLAGMIHSAGEKLHHLTENYLAYAQITLSAMDEKTMNGLREQITQETAVVVRSCARDTAEEFGRPADLTLEVEEGSTGISHDHLAKILTELMHNAFKFSPKGTTVRVTGAPEGAMYCVSIEDHGIGMTEEQVRSADFFRQFERSLHEQGGTGLGLTIARRLAELYGGETRVEGQKNKGTRVRVCLPLREEEG